MLWAMLADYYAVERSSLVDEATRMLRGDRMTAEDVVQASFLRLLARTSTDMCTYTSAIHAIVRTTMQNVIRDMWRRRQHRKDYERCMADARCGEGIDDVFAMCSAHQINELLEQRIARMDTAVAQVMRMNIVEGKAVSEIAKELDMKYKTAENRLQTGRRQLRSYIRRVV